MIKNTMKYGRDCFKKNYHVNLPGNVILCLFVYDGLEVEAPFVG